MWKVPVLLFVLGSASLWVPAAGASTNRPEDDIETPGVDVTTPAIEDVTTPGIEDVTTPGIEDVTTPGATEEPSKPAGPTTPMATSAKSTASPDIEDLPTLESTVPAKEESQSTTVPNVATSRSTDKVGGETRVTVDKGRQDFGINIFLWELRKSVFEPNLWDELHSFLDCGQPEQNKETFQEQISIFFLKERKRNSSYLKISKP
ncbi:podoplanin isoform X3 [Microcebus murinus]|uniref:podoplanin isoform X3 n=1 Tax=Microcebus murinus TaxID=30608 RepID=UPI003F6CB67B